MKKEIFTLLSVLALALAFTGCGESDGAYSSATTTGVSAPAMTEADVEATTFKSTNEFGINESLGTPPPLPAS